MRDTMVLLLLLLVTLPSSRVAPSFVLIEAVPAWVVHELALAAVSNACGEVWVVAVAATVVGDAGDIGVGNGERIAAAATVVASVVIAAVAAVRCLVFDVAVGVDVVVAGGLRLQLRYRVRIVVSYA